MADTKRLDRPIVILGAARSGTTILSRVLGQHRDVAHLIEPRMTWRYGNDRKSDMLSPEDATPRIIAHIRQRFGDYVEKSGKPRLVEKTPSNSIRPAFVGRVLPEARYIHIIRNGYDACLATEDFWDKHTTGVRNVAKGRLMQRIKELGPLRVPYYLPEFARRIAPGPMKRLLGPNQWGPRLPGMSAMLRDIGPLAVSCLQWRTCVELSCHFGRGLPVDRYFEMKLEDMSAGLIHKLLAFCELDRDEQVDTFIDETFQIDRVSARRSKASQEKIEQARLWIEPTIEWLGYNA
ncbi:MAG: sulfotransferase [Planctomycetota bacterium]